MLKNVNKNWVIITKLLEEEINRRRTMQRTQSPRRARTRILSLTIPTIDYLTGFPCAIYIQLNPHPLKMHLSMGTIRGWTRIEELPVVAVVIMMMMMITHGPFSCGVSEILENRRNGNSWEAFIGDSSRRVGIFNNRLLH